jgi:hypothetical protein
VTCEIRTVPYAEKADDFEDLIQQSEYIPILVAVPSFNEKVQHFQLFRRVILEFERSVSKYPDYKYERVSAVHTGVGRGLSHACAFAEYDFSPYLAPRPKTMDMRDILCRLHQSYGHHFTHDLPPGTTLESVTWQLRNPGAVMPRPVLLRIYRNYGTWEPLMEWELEPMMLIPYYFKYPRETLFNITYWTRMMQRLTNLTGTHFYWTLFLSVFVGPIIEELLVHTSYGWSWMLAIITFEMMCVVRLNVNNDWMSNLSRLVMIHSVCMILPLPIAIWYHVTTDFLTIFCPDEFSHSLRRAVQPGYQVPHTVDVEDLEWWRHRLAMASGVYHYLAAGVTAARIEEIAMREADAENGEQQGHPLYEALISDILQVLRSIHAGEGVRDLSLLAAFLEKFGIRFTQDPNFNYITVARKFFTKFFAAFSDVLDVVINGIPVASSGSDKDPPQGIWEKMHDVLGVTMSNFDTLTSEHGTMHGRAMVKALSLFVVAPLAYMLRNSMSMKSIKQLLDVIHEYAAKKDYKNAIQVAMYTVADFASAIINWFGGGGFKSTMERPEQTYLALSRDAERVLHDAHNSTYHVTGLELGTTDKLRARRHERQVSGELKDIHERATKMIADYAGTKEAGAIRSLIQPLVTRIAEAINKRDIMGEATKMAMTPFTVGYFGAPGVGKSQKVQQTVGVVGNALGYTDPYDGVYYRNSEDAYWSGLARRYWCVVFDDMNQIRPELQSSGSQMAFIQAVNSVPSLANMADLEDKGKILLDFDAVIVTANRPDFCCREIYTDNYAPRRRVQHNVVITVKPEFRKADGDQIDDAKVAAYIEELKAKGEYDPAREPEVNNYEVYNLAPAETGSIEPKHINVRHYSDWYSFAVDLRKCALEHFENQIRMLDGRRLMENSGFCPCGVQIANCPEHYAGGLLPVASSGYLPDLVDTSHISAFIYEYAALAPHFLWVCSVSLLWYASLVAFITYLLGSVGLIAACSRDSPTFVNVRNVVTSVYNRDWQRAHAFGLVIVDDWAKHHLQTRMFDAGEQLFIRSRAGLVRKRIEAAKLTTAALQVLRHLANIGPFIGLFGMLYMLTPGQSNASKRRARRKQRQRAAAQLILDEKNDIPLDDSDDENASVVEHASSTYVASSGADDYSGGYALVRSTYNDKRVPKRVAMDTLPNHWAARIVRDAELEALPNINAANLATMIEENYGRVWVKTASMPKPEACYGLIIYSNYVLVPEHCLPNSDDEFRLVFEPLVHNSPNKLTKEVCVSRAHLAKSKTYDACVVRIPSLSGGHDLRQYFVPKALNASPIMHIVEDGAPRQIEIVGEGNVQYFDRSAKVRTTRGVMGTYDAAHKYGIGDCTRALV